MAKYSSTNVHEDLSRLRKEEYSLMSDVRNQLMTGRITTDVFRKLGRRRIAIEDTRFDVETECLTEEDDRRFCELQDLFQKTRELLENTMNAPSTDLKAQERVLSDEPLITAVLPQTWGGWKVTAANATERNMALGIMPPGIKSLMESRGVMNETDVYCINGDFTFPVPICIKCEIQRHLDTRYYNIFAIVKEKTDWKQIPARLDEECCVSFEAACMEMFFLVSEIKTQRILVSPHMRFEYVSEVDSNIKLNFPTGTFESLTPLAIRVISVDEIEIKNALRFPDCNIIVNMSPIICVDYPSKTVVTKHVTMQLPFQTLKKFRKGKIFLLKMSDDVAEIIDTKPRDNGDGTFSCEIFGFSMYALAQTKFSSVDVRDPALKDEMDVLMGCARKCRILTFRSMRELFTLRTDIVPHKKVKLIIEKRRQEGYVQIGSESNVIILRSNQRIRVDLLGMIKKDPGTKGFGYFIEFQRQAETLQMTYPFVMNVMAGGSHYGIVKYSSDNLRKKELHWVHFDPSGRPNTQRSVFRIPEVLREKSLRVLSKKIPFSTVLDLGLNLNLTSTEVREIRMRCHKEHGASDPSLVAFEVLKAWAQKQDEDREEGKVQELLEALNECSLGSITERLSTVHSENRPLKMSDLN